LQTLNPEPKPYFNTICDDEEEEEEGDNASLILCCKIIILEIDFCSAIGYGVPLSLR
jgi:hypothetical protein